MNARVVVGAAVVHERRLLAARRTAPPAAAGRWELPGGKVDPGESDDEALVRELDEELGVQVQVAHWLPGEVPLTADSGPLVLRVAVVRLLSGEPRPREHDRLRWLDETQLADVDWLEADQPFVAAVGRLLRDEAVR